MRGMTSIGRAQSPRWCTGLYQLAEIHWCYDWAYQSEELINLQLGSSPRYGFWITSIFFTTTEYGMYDI